MHSLAYSHRWDAVIAAAVLINCCPVELIVPKVRPTPELYQSGNCAELSRPGRHLAFAYVIIASWLRLSFGPFTVKHFRSSVQDVEGQTRIQ